LVDPFFETGIVNSGAIGINQTLWSRLSSSSDQAQLFYSNTRNYDEDRFQQKTHTTNSILPTKATEKISNLKLTKMANTPPVYVEKVPPVGTPCQHACVQWKLGIVTNCFLDWRDKEMTKKKSC